jgi:S-adenosylmethionine:tRNA ribosyltransferase-isomerase
MPDASRGTASALRTGDFAYDLPPELIAQLPLEPRDHSRLMVVSRRAGTLHHRRFYDLPEFLGPKDLLVFNDSRVIPARLLARKAGTGGSVELLLLHRTGPQTWQALVKPGKRLKEGTVIELESPDRTYRATIEDRLDGGTRAVHFDDERAIEACGNVPLPPYIHEKLADPERYQTVYSRVQGSAAAPTAGLHFTPDLLKRTEAATAGLAFVTLHVGLDTFRPVEEEDPRRHHIHTEYAVLSNETAARIHAARAAGGRIVCVGTTSARVLETAAQAPRPQTGQAVVPFAGWTSLLILPGHRFRAIDALITNFHLPRSTLLMLVSAFAGKGLIDRAYAEAVTERYRFYSFGDAMLLL